MTRSAYTQYHDSDDIGGSYSSDSDLGHLSTGVLTSTPHSQRGSDLNQGYHSRQSSPSSSPRHCGEIKMTYKIKEDMSSVASYETSHNTFNLSPSTGVPNSMVAAVQRDGVLTSTPQSQ